MQTMRDSDANRDIAIVGLGLAGSLLAWELARLGRDPLVIDDGRDGSSRVAAGLVNPITGPRIRLTPGSDRLLPALHRCIGGIERELGIEQPLFHPVDMLRPFRDQDMRERWRERLADADYAGFLPAQPLNATELRPCVAPLGGFRQRGTGWLEIPRLLDALQDWLERRGSLARTHLDPKRVVCRDGQVFLDDQRIRVRHLVFCDGWRLTLNPWFDWLPMQPAKGEILNLEGEAPTQRHIYNAGRWLIPLGDGRLRFGATNSWQPLDSLATKAARDQLQGELRRLFPTLAGHLRIAEQVAGVRPGTRDRQPLIGNHPQAPRIHVFNGFGAKGSLLIPSHAARFARVLCGRDSIAPETNIQRYTAGARVELPSA